MNNLKASIITVCLNSEDTIEKTIKSVISQTHPNIEYIIVDGKSTDNTLNITNKYSSNIDILISEKDDGIYDAMNKGAKLATGDIVYFLNSGDFFYNEETVEKLSNLFIKNDDIDIIYGYYVYYSNNYVEVVTTKRNNNFEIIARGINHQSIFARKKVFQECGSFNTSYKLYGDYDWLLRALVKCHQKIMYIDIPIAYYLGDGFSDKYYRIFRYERFDISMKYLNPVDLIKYFFTYPVVVKQDLKIKIFKTFRLRDFK